MAQFPAEFPRIVCLCGSTKFKKEYIQVNKELTLEGYIVVTVGFFGHADNDPISSAQKYKLDVLHLRKIELADAVYVIDPEEYTGDSTKREIEYAKSLGRPIQYWSARELNTKKEGLNV